MSEPTSIFTRAELDELARSPLARVEAAAALGPDPVLTEVAALEQRFRRGLRGFAAWEAGSLEALRQQPDSERAVRAAIEHCWVIGSAHDVTVADLHLLDGHHADAIADTARTSGPAAAIAEYRAIEAGYRRLHDAHRDTVSAIWTALLEHAGRDAFERCLRDLAEASLLVWMDVDRTTPPRQRLEEWAAVTTTNFSAIRIDEHPDRFVLTQDPCGSCGRQVRDGSYDGTMQLATIEPFGPADAVGTEPVPIYRSHVGLMHWLIPVERLGHPWPVVRCPAGMAASPCRIELHKDPVTAS